MATQCCSVVGLRPRAGRVTGTGTGTGAGVRARVGYGRVVVYNQQPTDFRTHVVTM